MRITYSNGRWKCYRTHSADRNKTKSFDICCADNPLICSCELIWFPNLLQDLKNRDDEMTQKKRPMCTMANEHREYFVQSMPVERMNCIGKNLGISSLSGANTSKRLQSNLSSCTVLILSLYSVITAYFLNWIGGAHHASQTQNSSIIIKMNYIHSKVQYR